MVERALRLDVHAPPRASAANDEIIAFFAKMFRVPKKHVRIVMGDKGRDKVVLLEGVGASAVALTVEAQMT